MPMGAFLCYNILMKNVLQKWEGVVTYIGADYFIADLTTTEGQEDDCIAEITYKETGILENSLSIGTLFHWTITEKTSVFVFNPYPPYTKNNLDDARKKGGEMAEAFS